MSKFFISDPLPADVRAVTWSVSKSTFYQVDRHQVTICFKYVNTCSTSHTKVYLGLGGLELNTPAIS